MITAREIDPADDDLLDSWYAVFRAGAIAEREAAIVISHQALTFALRNQTAQRARHAVAAFDGDQVVGAMLVEYNLQDNLDSIEVEIDVPPAQRRRGIATALWGWARGKAASLERTIFQCELGIPEGFTADTWPGAVFATKLGFTVEHTEDHLVVPLPYDVPVQAEPLEGYELISWAGPCPEECLQALADLRTAMDRDVPTGGMTKETKPWEVDRLRQQNQRIDENYLALLTMARTTDGRPAGYTLIYLPRADAENAQQDDTLVLREHRGHNLGTHLKLANLEQLAKYRTTQKWLHTWTAESNTAMQKVNARFGFRTVEKHTESELTVPAPVLRPAARGIVLDRDDRILLLRFELDNRTVWATPGGGVEPGETVRECLVRELREEVGLEAPPDAPHVWHRVTVNDFMTDFDGAVNDYFLIRADAFTPAGTFTEEEMAAENVHGHRWWSLAELQSHTGPGVLSPRALPYLLAKLLQDGPPATPIFQAGL